MSETHAPARLDLGPLYQDYAYAYPHKTAYRAFEAPRRLRDVWANENTERTFLYVHIPFCEMRCGFCNLFATANPDEDRVEAYLNALECEMASARDEIGAVSIARAAIGGGTPTFLEAPALERLFDKLESLFGVNRSITPLAIETSPKTATVERIAVLAARGVARISIGAQSFLEEETKAMGRPQKPAELTAALETIRAHCTGRLNIDLIYGASNQTPDSFRRSIRQALSWRPEEIYLYPLYVRPSTGLDGRARTEDMHRLRLYRAGRDLLASEGYEQVSMRAFRRAGLRVATDEYSCQEDGMLGFGAGARSYTSQVHYSTDYAVSRGAVSGILQSYMAQDASAFRYIHHGMDIDAGERMRRFVLKSILRVEGLNSARFEEVFGVTPLAALPQLEMLLEARLLETRGAHLVPTESGLEHADAIPPLFYSDAVRARMSSAAIL